MPDGPRYEDDFYAWTRHQAEVLRSMPVSDNRFDREHVAEEIEDLGKSERDAVRSQIRRIIEHLLKLAYSPADAAASRVDGDDRRRTGNPGSDKLTGDVTPADVEAGFEKLYAEGVDARAARGLRRGTAEPDAAEALPADLPLLPQQIFTVTIGTPIRPEKSHDTRFVGYGAGPPHAHWPGDAASRSIS